MIKPFLRSFRLLSRRHRIIFFSLLSARVATNIFDVLGLMAVGLLGAMLASGLNERESATFVGISVEIQSSQTYFWIVLVIAAFFIGKSMLGVVLIRLSSLFFARVESKFSSEIAEFLYRGSLSHLKSFSRGDVLFAVGTSPGRAISGLLMSGSSIIAEGVLFLSVVAIFLLVDAPTAAIISVYFIALVSLFQLSINRRLRLSGQQLSSSSIGMTNIIQDMTNSFREISVLAKHEFFLSRFYALRRRYALSEALLSFLAGLPRFFIESALMIGVLALIGYQFLRGNLSDGLVTTAVFLAGGLRMMAALLPIQSAVSNVKAYGPQAALTHRLLPEARAWKQRQLRRDENLRGSPLLTANSAGLAISVQNLSFSHPDAPEPALRDITLEISTGSFVAFVGPSGAGKTTLADLILGVNLPQAGCVEISGWNPKDFREVFPGSVAYVPQNPGMVSGTIAENIALGENKDVIDENRVWQSLEQAELGIFVRSLPEGIYSDLGAQADSLSGGQKQRLGLARALYTSPRLLVLDEATSALDASTEASIAESIRKLGEATTVIVIAHRLSTIQHADKVYVLEDGRISAQGTFREVRRKVPMIEEYVRLMSIDE